MVSNALQIISVFSKASGLRLNMKKCELLALYDCIDTELMSIPVKKEVKYLGVKMVKDEKQREEINMKEKIDQIQVSLNHWLSRDLSIFGRNLLSKAEGISKLIYPCQSLYIAPKNVRKINSIIYKFIWRNKTYYVKKSQLVKEYNKGGIKTVDFEAMLGTFKIKWLKEFLLKPDSIWFHIPKSIFKRFGGLNFLLKCDFEISKIPFKLSEFHKQVLHHWKMVFTHNFTPHCATLWNNRVIVSNKKSLFNQLWFDQGIILVHDILDVNGEILQLKDFKNKFNNIQCSLKEYKKICKSIPVNLIQLIKNTISFSNVQIKLPNLTIGELNITDKKCDNKYLNKAFKGYIYHDYDRKIKLKILDNPTIAEKHWKFIKWPIAPKVKEMQFKILNNYYPSAETLRGRFGYEVDPCDFCHENPERTEHLFFLCSVSRKFWQDVQRWLDNKISELEQFTIEDILIYNSKLTRDLSLLINLIIIMGKYHIHKNKWKKQLPNVNCFKNEFRMLLSSLNLVKNSKQTVEAICYAAEMFLIL